MLSNGLVAELPANHKGGRTRVPRSFSHLLLICILISYTFFFFFSSKEHLSTFPQWKPINPQEEVTEKLTEPHCKQRHRDSPSCGLQITIFPSLNCRPLTTERAPQSSLPRMRMNCTRFRLMFTLHQTK